MTRRAYDDQATRVAIHRAQAVALAIVCGVGTTFFTVELEQLVERSITPHIESSRGVATMNREV